MNAPASLCRISNLRRVKTTMEENVKIITSPRGARAAWDAGMFDAIVLAVHATGGEEALTHEDRTIIAVAALKFWPGNNIVETVGRVLSVEDTVCASGRGAAIAMLQERDKDRHLVDAMFRPILFASTLRGYAADEIARLTHAVEAIGIEPRFFGLRS